MAKKEEQYEERKMKEHKHCARANCHDALLTFIGCEVKGILFDRLPIGRRDLSDGNKTIVFACGWGLTLADNGSYWAETPEEIKRAISIEKEILANNRKATERILSLAGE